MGNIGQKYLRNFSPSNGTISTFTDRQTYIMGETVNGFIRLKVPYGIRKAKLVLRLCGSEKIERRFNSCQRFRVRKQKVQTVEIEEKELMNVEVPIYSGVLLYPGKHTFPFRLLLPYHLPGTFLGEGENLLVNISYVLAAELWSQEGSGLILRYDYDLKISSAYTSQELIALLDKS